MIMRAKLLISLLVASLLGAAWFFTRDRSDPPQPGDTYAIVSAAHAKGKDHRRFYRRFAALADEGEPLALKWVLDRAAFYQGPDEEKDIARYLEAVVKSHAQDARFTSVARRIGIFAHWAGVARVGEIGLRWRKQGAHAETMPGLLASLSELLLESQREAEAKQCLEQLTIEYPRSNEAREAEGTLFRLNNLRPGMAAPDLEAVDVDGESFELSDYRGRVVLLDFWGFW